ncbi:unnamed protein product [Phaedon cochleariae]|uniref:MADF domain-containing protein n=1 Tax=Phaedon cochleariae TaxID=80249 RepID=A0A9N9SJQ7_PHACE|nr:unnamed protein product [Phaedon cochleariae]
MRSERVLHHYHECAGCQQVAMGPEELPQAPPPYLEVRPQPDQGNPSVAPPAAVTPAGNDLPAPELPQAAPLPLRQLVVPPPRPRRRRQNLAQERWVCQAGPQLKVTIKRRQPDDTVHWGDFKVSHLRTPVHSKLKRTICKDIKTTQLPTEKDIFAATNEPEPSTSASWSAKRRPITSGLASSDISKKYIMLADFENTISKTRVGTMEPVRKRWQNLIDRFVRAYRDYNKKPPSGSAGGSKKTVEFVYFHQMIWLAPFLRKRKLTTSVETTESENIQEAVEETEELINSVEDCMRAWKNLRYRFVKEKNRRPSGSGASDTNWPYFQAMLFYSKFTKPRKTYTSTTKRHASREPLLENLERPSTSTRPSSSTSNQSLWSSITIESITSPELVESPCDAASPTERENVPSCLQTPSRSNREESVETITPTASSGGNRKRKKKEKDEQVESLLNMAKTIATSIESRPTRQKNANSTFVDYVYEELERLTEANAKKQRKQILSILFNDDDSD